MAVRRRGSDTAQKDTNQPSPSLGGALECARAWAHRREVLVCAGRFHLYHLPRCFVDMAFASEYEPPIRLFELAAAILTSGEAAYWPDGNHRTCALFVDNQSALASPLKGPPSSELGDILANLSWSVASQILVAWRFEYVGAK